MDAGTILIFGAVLLGLGSLSLFVARSTNPGLKGLGWMAASFATGAAATGLLLVSWLPHPVEALLPDLLTLLPYVLLQVAIFDLLGKLRLPSTGLLLLACMAAMDLLYAAHYVGDAFRISTISALVAAQCLVTSRSLRGYRGERGAAWFFMTILYAFSGYNLLRAVLSGTGLAHRWHIGVPLQILSFIVFILAGLGLAFGFFWLSNAWLSTKLEEIAGSDPLTRVYNRRAFLRACEKELRVSLRKGRPFSVLMADIDHFKAVNDRFGHNVGDEALVAVVERMQDSIRGIDVLARWGGEEFVVLLPNANEEAARIVAERMRANVARAEFPFLLDADGEAFGLTVSIGAATFQPQDDVHTLISRADEFLYLAKDAGRNRVLQGEDDHSTLTSTTA